MAYMGGGGAGLLFGLTDLGDVKIRFCDIKTIETLAAESNSSPIFRLTSPEGRALVRIKLAPLFKSAQIPQADGQVFDRWSGASVANPASSNTSLIMPAADATISANYKPVPSTNEVKELVQKALAAANAQIAIGGAYSGSYVKEGNSAVIWRALFDSLKGGEIPELRRIISLRRGQNDSLMHWKAIAFLTYSLRMDEGKAQAEAVFSQLMSYEIYEPWDPLIRTTVDDALFTVPSPPERKNQMIIDYVKSGDPRRGSDLLGILSSAPNDSARENTRIALMALLKDRPDLPASAFPKAIEKCAPPDNRFETAEALLGRLEQSPNQVDGSPLLLFKSWSFTNSIPRVRRLCSMVSDSSVLNLTHLLADWQDKSSEPDIRAIVERYRYGENDGYFLDAALADFSVVGGPAADGYVAQVIRSAPPSAQKILLAGSLRKITSSLVRQSIEELSRNSVDPEVRRSGAPWLGSDARK